ncbi:MAG: hypothetical protein ACM3NN_11945 [Nitrospirota bacterium]
MNRKILLAVAIAVLATPAMADEYYIVQNPTTKVCHIVSQKPESSVGIVIGTPFGARIEAENHMKTVKICHDETIGSGTTTIIKK